ncbi:TetR/AcrR family transcriptional regulator [Streptosporangium lutulentum]
MRTTGVRRVPEHRPRADALRNSDRIVRAAITALRESGVAVPLEEIARRAGVGIATVYRRFGDRDGVIRACFETYFTEEVEPLALAAREAADPRQGLAEALDAVIGTLAAHRSLLTAAREAARSRSPSPNGSRSRSARCWTTPGGEGWSVPICWSATWRRSW